jgi:serine/threonine-protein kinase RsbW
MPLELNVSLSLPRDAMSVMVVRHLCDYALGELAVVDSCRSDIAIALTEACTNVVDHSSAAHPYEVNIRLTPERCSIGVRDPAASHTDLDLGELEDPARRGQASPDAETGRGIELMQALVDRVAFTVEPEDGMVVHLYKDLEFEESHPVAERLLR